MDSQPDTAPDINPASDPDHVVPGAPAGTRVVQIDKESLQQLNQAEVSIHRWNGKYMELGMEMRGIESTVHALQQHKAELMTSTLEKLGVDVKRFNIATVLPDGRAFLVPNKGQPAGPAPADPAPD